LASSAQDPGILRQLGAAIIAMRGMVSHVASNDALANLSDEVRALARKVDQAMPSGGSLFALEERIAMLADALEAHNQRRQNTPHDLEGVVMGLMEKIDRLQLAVPNHAGIRHLEERIGQLVAKLEVSGARLNHLEAIEHGLTELLAHLENQRMPHAASRARAASQLPELPVAAAEPVEIAQSLRAAASPARERRPIEPDLPPDHPLEPGSGAARGANAHSPAVRIIASEAARGGVKPSIPPHPIDKASFIAAARRATQAAGRGGGGRSGARTSSGIAFANGKLATPLARWRALMVGVAALALVLGSVALAKTLLSAGEETEPRSATRSSAAPAPNATLAQEPDLPAPAPSQQQPVVPAVEGTQSLSVPVDLPREIIPVAPEAPKAEAAPTAAEGETQLPKALGSVLRTAAANGDADAQYEVALRYFEGRGVPQDLTVAAEWFERSARQGLVAAQFRLGGMHEKGLGVKKDLEAARRYYLAAGGAGHGKAMHNLAVLYAESIERKPDYKAAAIWFRRAADYGIANSQYNLAILYARGIGVEQNLAESYKWFALAARAGDQESAKKRDDVGARLDQHALAAATRAARAWKPQPQAEAALQVSTPASVWDPGLPSAAASPSTSASGAGPKLDLATANSSQ
jgi:localization factor PodJL